jgi:2-hydroxycyclohexanecarboxyl-CoA dehydrogenase
MSATRTAVVTGGASGIGLAIAERLARDGLAVAVFDLDGEAARRAAAGIEATGAAAMAVEVDVASPTSITAGVDAVRAQLGPVLVLVNNAGVDTFGPMHKVTLDEWNRTLAVNLTGTFLCCQVISSDMVEAGWGRIVNISSSSAQGGQAYLTPYVASKAGVIGFTKALALELGPRGITVNTIPPGFIDTPMLRHSEEQGRLAEGVEHWAALSPVRRVGHPDDIASACSFLVSDDASYITGQVIGVNGGRNT